MDGTTETVASTKAIKNLSRSDNIVVNNSVVG